MDALTDRRGSYNTGALILSGDCQPPTQAGNSNRLKNISPYFGIFYDITAYYQISQDGLTDLILQDNIKQGGTTL